MGSNPTSSLPIKPWLINTLITILIKVHTMINRLLKGFERFNTAMTDPRLPLVLDNSMKLVIIIGTVIGLINFVLIMLRIFNVV